MRRFILLFAYIALTVSTLSARNVITINDNWRFYFTSENSADYARTVSQPHTWCYENSRSVVSTQPTTANYIRTMYAPAEWSNKRVFIKFYGVESIADLFINGSHVGEHRGGSTAFTFEIGDRLQFGSDNRIQVIVNNAPQSDILPTSREEDNSGGIYRDVEIIVTDKTNVSPLYYGSDGVLVHQKVITAQKAEGEIAVHLSSTTSQMCHISLSIINQSGDVIFQRSVAKARIGDEPTLIPFSIGKPNLWSPSEPNLYTFRMEVSDGQMRDVVSVKSGFRSIDIGSEGYISLNEVPTPIRAVTLFHDYPHIGGAASARDIDTDLEIISELGANTIRSAHHPHHQYLYDRCDELGQLAWIDFPLVKAPFLSDIAYYPTEAFESAGRVMLQEMVAQNINHPSVIMWGIFTLLTPRGDNPIPYITEINRLAKALDPSRPTVAISNQDGAINNITDLIVWRQNLGWDRGSFSDIDVWRNLLHTKWSYFRSGVAYGESGRIDQQAHDSKFSAPTGLNNDMWLPEGRQRQFHEEYSSMLLSDSLFWGVCIDNIFDFKTSRNSMGENNSGLVSFDRRDRKDIFYLYKSVWNRAQPTLHIAGSRQRVTSEPLYRLKVYSSEESAPLLYSQSDTIEMRMVGPAHFEVDSLSLNNGRNHFVVRQGELCDSINITLQSTPATTRSRIRP